MHQVIQRKEDSVTRSFIQPSLEIGKEDDEHEVEANAVADKVMKMSDSEGEKKKMKESSSKVQMMPDAKTGMMQESPVKIQMFTDSSTGGMLASQNVEQGINNSKGAGQSLPSDLQNEFGNKMNADFTDVKVHTDENAAQMNKEVGAKAFAHGNDLYFNKGQYNPTSNQGKHLLAHELTHTIQQGKNVKRKIQRFVPKDAAAEMIGRQFKLNMELKAGLVTYPKGSVVTITKWDNASASITGNVTVNKKTDSLSIQKQYLTPIEDTKSGLVQYHTNLSTTLTTYQSKEKEIKAQEKVISNWNTEKSKYTTPKGLAEWQRQMDVHTTKLKDLKYELTGEGYTAANLPARLSQNIPLISTLNDNLIQQEMYNAFDANIVKWIDHYHTEIGVKKGWKKPDGNLIKSVMFQETQMGTMGPFMLKSRFEGDPMTHYNLMQGIDSSGSILTLMMNEMDSALAAKYKINDVKTDLYKTQKRYGELKKLKTLSTAEDKELKEINRRAPDTKYSKLWDSYFWTDPRFYNAWIEFNKQPAKLRTNDYDFWVRAGIRWIYEKRNSENTWEEAIRAYNGSGDKAAAYKVDVVGRRDAAVASKGTFIPQKDY